MSTQDQSPQKGAKGAKAEEVAEILDRLERGVITREMAIAAMGQIGIAADDARHIIAIASGESPGDVIDAPPSD